MMAKIRRTFLFCMALMISVACSKQEGDPDQQGNTENEDIKSAISVPLKGSFDVYIFKVIHEPPPPPLEQLTHGNGKLTHLGKTKITLNQFWWPPELAGEPGKGNGRIFFSAANGDILLAEYDEGLAYQISAECVEITFTGQFIDGGSGRFQYAEGWFTWEETYNPTINEGTSVLSGVISYGREPF